MERVDEYDFLLINDDFKQTLEKFQDIVEVSRMKIDKKSKDNFINSWYNS